MSVQWYKLTLTIPSNALYAANPPLSKNKLTHGLKSVLRGETIHWALDLWDGNVAAPMSTSSFDRFVYSCDPLDWQVPDAASCSVEETELSIVEMLEKLGPVEQIHYSFEVIVFESDRPESFSARKQELIKAVKAQREEKAAMALLMSGPEGRAAVAAASQAIAIVAEGSEEPPKQKRKAK